VEYAEAVRLDPGLADGYYGLAICLEAKGKPEEAIDLYREALERNPSHEAAHYNLGYALASMGRFRDALPHFQKASRLGLADATQWLSICKERIN